jgi:hypothetical protein
VKSEKVRSVQIKRGKCEPLETDTENKEESKKSNWLYYKLNQLLMID